MSENRAPGSFPGIGGKPAPVRPFGWFVASGFSWALGAGGGDWLAPEDLEKEGSASAGAVWNSVGVLVAPGWPGLAERPEGWPGSGLSAAELGGFVSRALLSVPAEEVASWEAVQEGEGPFWAGEVALLWSVAAFLSGSAPLPPWLALSASVCSAPESARWLPVVPSAPGSLVAVPACPVCAVALLWVGGGLRCPSLG